MIDFKQYASSSKGNLYAAYDEQTGVLIEMGLPIKMIKKALNFNLSKISGALLSHEHLDHSHAAKDILRMGIPLFASQGTLDALKLSGHNVHIVKALKQFKIDTFSVLPFDVQHDASEPLGFLLVSGKDKLCFITDTPFVKYKFKGLTTLAIECNYQSSLLQQNIDAGLCGPGLKERLLKTHMSLSQVIGFLKANDLRTIRDINILHLSSRNANGKQMKDTIVKMFGKPVNW